MNWPILILAAGFGTRLRPLTETRPKALVEVGGMTLIDHALNLADDLPSSEIAVNGHYLAEDLFAHLPAHVRRLHEKPDILDSGGAVKNARRSLGAGPMITLNADNAWRGPNPLKVLAEEWKSCPGKALMLLVPRERAVGRIGGGDFRLEDDGRIGPSTEGYVYTGAQILGSNVGSDFEADIFSMWEIWNRLLSEGSLYGAVYPGRWADVGNIGGLALAEKMLSEASHVPSK